MANLIWGFGGVKITYAAQVADFPFANGAIKMIPEGIIRTSKAGTDIHNFKGWRPEIVIDLICMTGDEARELVKLITMINSAAGRPLTVFPRHATSLNPGLSYQCNILTEISPRDIADSPVGQDLTLQFRAINRITQLPSNLTDTSQYEVVETISGVTYNITEPISSVAYNITETL